jgi:cyclophilin family peptidyl-prolyl cis-trans isomerase
MKTSIRWIASLVLVSVAALLIADPMAAHERSVSSTNQSPTDEHQKVEAVLETSRGEIVIEFFPKEAPAHVDYFIKQARAGAYDGTTFHRMFKNGLIQGGDPLTKNAAAKARYGTGGLNAGLPDEVNKYKHVGGAVSAAMALNPANPNEVKPGSSGAQFFIVVGAQSQLDAKFTVFGRVVEGMDVAASISNAPTNPSNIATERIEIKKVTIREKTPSIAELKAMKVTIQTTLGDLKVELQSDSSPNTVREFIRYVKAGIYDGAAFFRVSGKYYMEVGFLDTWPTDSPNRKRFFSLWSVPAEMVTTKHVRGTISMSVAADGNSSWYFFIISKDNPALDGKHVPFANVTEGLDVIDKIAETEVEGDKPKTRIEIKRVLIE